jgi:soluble lytic murein transglycosylase
MMRRSFSLAPILLAASACLWATFALAAQASGDADALRRAMDALRAGDWETAAAEGRRSGEYGSDVIEWHRLRAGRGDFDEVVAFLERRGDWPGLPLLRRRSEGAVPYGRRAEDVVAFFADNPPQTGAGSIALASAYEALGRKGDAEAQIVLAWVSQELTTGDEASLVQRYGDLLKPHHVDRLDMLLWSGEGKAAERMFPLVPEGWRSLARARIALRDMEPGVDARIEAIPAELADDPGLAFERFQWRARKGRNESAIELALSRNGIEALGRPGPWADWRAVLARWAMRSERPAEAYQLAARHGLTDGADYAELEWLAGYIALTQLDDPDAALWHFQRFRIAVSTPISMGRAGYWEGRAHEALGDDEAAAIAYAFGAENQTSFYGLLAAERAGLPMDPALAGTLEYPDWKTADFVDSSVFKAALLLREAGESALAERFLTHLAESLDDTGAGQLAEFAFSIDDPHIALMIAKRAAEYGRVLPRAYYPVVDLGVTDPRVPLELALAIARRESEFDHDVMSGVGARGLMQVMPATAEEVAGKLDIDFDNGRLLNDPVYNARIGKAYLAELIEMFGPNYVLVSAAYNAGPSRPMRWMSERGDPRSAGVDVVDWIESIPFTETRNYVMRVMESLPVYRARLAGKPVPIGLTDALEMR